MDTAASREDEGASADSKKLRVLVVDDQPAVCEVVADTIAYAGHEIVGKGRDGVEAISLAKDLQPDLVVMDIAMPRMNGQELADCMNLRHPEAPIIFMSGYPKSREILAGLTGRGFRNGYTYLEKPFAGKELLAIVRTALNPTLSLTPRLKTISARP